ncbi:MAG: DUF2769 domain-containing protein [Deltaproteobacteria bacterium]|nr:DUF2769 domain-containing protein [Deltaproteobacteria bacterium]
MGKLDRIDKFGVETMSKVDYLKKQDYVVKNCKCTGCPTYVKGDKSAGFCFPFIGTSSVIQKEKDCVCETCPVYEEHELSHMYYCTRCSQVCQSLKTEGGTGGWG